MYLVVLSVALILPLLLVSVALLAGFVRSEIQAGRDRLVRDAASIGADVDREVSGLITVLDTLATSSSLDSGDLATFHARATAALASRDAYVLVLDTNLQQLLNTRRPFGTALPKTSNEESARIVLQTRDVSISDSFIGAVSGQRVINILRPVMAAGQVRYILTITVGTDRFSPILHAGQSRDEYAVLLLDAKDQVMAKVPPKNRTAAEAQALEIAKAQKGVTSRNIADEVWLETTHQSDLTGWRTVVRVPRAALYGPLWHSLYLLAFAALTTIAVAAAAIAFVTKRVSSSIAAIREATRRLAAGQPLPPTEPSVLEAVSIMQGLGDAGALIEARTRRLRESEARYRTALRLGKMGSWETDFVRRTRNWSPEAASLFDLPRYDGIVGGVNDELVAAMHPDDRPLLSRFHDHLLTHDELDAEYRIVLRDGSVHHVAGRGLVISRQPSGAPHILINVVADVTERAKAEEYLSEFAANLATSKARFEALVEAAAQIVWTATPSGEIVEDSPSWRAFTGQSLEDFLGDGWLAAVHPDDRERTQQAWMQAVNGRGVYVVDYRLTHVDGGYRWTRTRGVPLTTASDTVVEWVGMNEDIDDRVRRNAQLDIVSRELSHRTKNLLAVIQSIARRSFAVDPSESRNVRTFLDRLQGLAISHDLLVHANWSGVSLKELVLEHLKPFVGANDGAVEIDGPILEVSPAAAQNFGLALHELATNSAKYGALKGDARGLRISWTLSQGKDGEVLDFRWSEIVELASPVVGRGGFGSQLLDNIVGASVGGSTSYRVTEGRVDWQLTAPLDRISKHN